ncbi:MAG TPA: tetratricopeptide repeat protein [Longimicrobiales bacterium]|nr:tetratricopeptide repeat protein [Longimicrobiales bacterium]
MSTPDTHPSRLSQFVAETKRRHVVRFALGYAAVAFVVLQLAEIVFPAFGIGETGLRILVVVVALLFPPALVLAWIFDVTTQGIERTEHTPELRAGLLPQLALLGVTVLVMLGVGAWLVREGVLDEPEVVKPGRGPAPGSDEPALVAYQAGTPIRSLAVLPLDDFSGDGAQDYFTAGMQEELIAQLSQLPGLRVVSRTSVQRYAGAGVPIPRIGRDLQVDAVIEGSVRRGEGQVRITVQLIHAASDTHLWTQQYDRSLENVLALQSEVALDIARQIQAEVSPEDADVLQRVAARIVDPEAQDAYLRGRYEADKGTPEGLAAARDHFEAAVQEDSSFAPALAGLAGTRFLLGLADTTLGPEELSRAQEEAERAVALDTAYQEAREVLDLIKQSLPARGATPAAVPAPPGTPDTAWFLALTRFGRQIEEQVRVRGVASAHDATMGRYVGARGLMAAGQYSDAVGLLSDVLAASPDMGPAWELLARAQMSAGNPQGAVAAMEGWSARGDRAAPTTMQLRDLRDAVARDGAMGYWRWMEARLEARVAAGEHVPALELAAARAGSGDKEGAFHALEQAVAQHDRGLVLLQRDPVWDVLRTDPRFPDIARRSRTTHVMVMPPEPRRPR